MIFYSYVKLPEGTLQLRNCPAFGEPKALEAEMGSFVEPPRIAEWPFEMEVK